MVYKHDKNGVDVVIHLCHSILNVEDTISADFGASSGSWSLSLSRCFLILQYFTSVYKSAIRISKPEIDKAAMQPASLHVLPVMRHNLTIEILKSPSFPKIAEMYPRGNYGKGQLNSEWIYEVIVSPKMPTKNYQDFCPTL